MSESTNPSTLDIPAILEALLFVSAEPVSPLQLATVLDLSISEVENGLKHLDNELQGRGLRLQRHSGRVQLTTAPEVAEIVVQFLGLEATSHLSRAALETLAIVAYQQPVTRPYLEGVRGVSSDSVMKSLLSKGLIQEMGRADGPGRPILYGTAPDFLQHFGLNSLNELPALALPEANGENGHDQALKG
jgi:segregation and condensation protein B